MAQVHRDGNGEGLLRSVQSARRSGSLLRTSTDGPVSRCFKVPGAGATEVGETAMIPTGTLVERLRSCYSGAVFDVLRANGYVQQTLPHYIRPLNLQHKLAGPIFT